jgi:hypothetical protein
MPALPAIPFARQVLPGSDKLFEHDSVMASADSKQLNSINVLGSFSEYCRLIEERDAQHLSQSRAVICTS